jgi:hypothetical protein
MSASKDDIARRTTVQLTPRTNETKLKNGTHSYAMSNPSQTDTYRAADIRGWTNLRRDKTLSECDGQRGANPHDLREREGNENRSLQSVKRA